MARIQPLAPPYAPEVAEQLAAMMPPGVPPILLFRTMATNLAVTRALSGWGGYELGQDLSLTMRDREIVIDRTCARCGCEYEWGVHVAFFAERCELTTEQIASLTHGSADDVCWHTERDRLLIRAVDELHDASDLSDELYASLASVFSDAEILDLLLLCGWYHAISFVARAARVDREPGAPTFADYAPTSIDGPT